jgi:cytochrome c-type biogenesis protein CcmH/NrfG
MRFSKMRLFKNNSLLPWILVGAVFGAASMGCGGGAGSGKPAVDPVTGQGIKTGRGEAVSQAAATKFKDGLKILEAGDKGGWTEAKCKDAASYFENAVDEQGSKTFFEALYNKGVAYQRCNMHSEARETFQEILDKNSKFHRARVQVALYKYRDSGEKDVDAAVEEMKTAIADAEFKNVEALVNLAMLQMRRNGEMGDSGCDNDFACAKLNLQRALAINDGFMPAFNQLAVYYLETAKKKAGRKGGRIQSAATKQKKADTAALELAALVVSQAVRKNPKYAPVYNTSGLISVELGELSSAAQAFGTARKLNGKFFEAHMNYAAVNLSFRGFRQSEDAYRKALALRPKDFEAHLGLALAIRGQLSNPSIANFKGKMAEVKKHIDAARALAPERPETYYNEAIFVQEFEAREAGGGDKAEPIMMKAKGLFEQFISKASGKDEYGDAVKRAEERMEEIAQIVEFNKQTRDEQKRMEAMRRAQEAKKQLEKKKK